MKEYKDKWMHNLFFFFFVAVVGALKRTLNRPTYWQDQNRTELGFCSCPRVGDVELIN